jgi:hypothetical protein
MTYYNNLHRDWSWGDEENRLSLEAVGALQSVRRFFMELYEQGRLAV